MARYFVFYGSLKRGFYNFNRFGGQEYVRDITIPDFALHDLGAYPAAVRAPGEAIHAEIHTVKETPAGRIRAMEMGAGYEEIEVPLGDGEMAKMYIMPRAPQYSSGKVRDGVWLKGGPSRPFT